MAAWLALPSAITAYINHKYAPSIHIGSTKIGVGIDGCVRLHNITVSKPTVYGVINSAVFCYKSKTVDVDGGQLEVHLQKSSGKDTSDSQGYKISGKNLNVHLVKGDITADLSGVTLGNKTCASKVIVSHPKVDAIVFDGCLNRDTQVVTAGNGTISPKVDLHGHKISEITFTGISLATKTELIVNNIKYEDNTATNVHAAFIGDVGELSIGYLSIYHKRIFKSPVSVRNVQISGISKTDPLSSKITVSLDDRVSVLVDVEKKHISGQDDCSQWLEVVPEELKTWPISQMKVKGSFSFDVGFAPVSLKIKNGCKIDGPDPQFITELGKPFKYTAYHPDGTPFERTSGPGTMDWIPLNFVDNMATALTITEDPGFWNHRGIIPQALENSLKDDLRLGRFFRGGSTITMQLAKNLWLSRNKSLGRKLQESILTVALESCLTKEKILELYLNVVEFGPNTYGIGPGCARFLKKYPGEITISEAVYMALRLPAPNRARSYEANKGFIQKLIAIGVASGKISEAELARELQAQQVKDADDEDLDEEGE